MRNVSFFDRIFGIITLGGGEITNLSSPVWLNGWSQSFDHLIASNGWGVGLNRMGCGALAWAGYLSPLIMGEVESVLNSTDGSFLFAKVVAELGVLGFLICIYISVVAFQSVFALMRINASDINEYALREETISRAAAGLTVLIFIYIRGISYFSFPLMLAVTFLLRSQVRHSLEDRPSIAR
jgi:hypothetical protein